MRIAAILLALAGVSAQSVTDGASFRFHHLHLNGAGLIEFYSRLFDPSTTSQPTVAGQKGLRSGPMLLLFSPPAAGVPSAPSAIWHFGWGTVTLAETYLAHAAREVEWEPPLPAGRLHVHVLSKAPGVAAAWYRDVFHTRVELAPGIDAPTRAEAARPERRVAEAIVYFGEFALVIYRTAGPLGPSRGQRVDHVALACPNLDDALTRLRALKVPILEPPAPFGETRAALIEGPDKIGIELVEVK